MPVRSPGKPTRQHARGSRRARPSFLKRDNGLIGGDKRPPPASRSASESTSGVQWAMAVKWTCLEHERRFGVHLVPVGGTRQKKGQQPIEIPLTWASNTGIASSPTEGETCSRATIVAYPKPTVRCSSKEPANPSSLITTHAPPRTLSNKPTQ